jgi:hypothetical protein
MDLPVLLMIEENLLEIVQWLLRNSGHFKRATEVLTVKEGRLGVCISFVMSFALAAKSLFQRI